MKKVPKSDGTLAGRKPYHRVEEPASLWAAVEGDFWEWDYTVMDGTRTVMRLSKELWNWTDTYSMDITHPEDALYCLMIVFAIDAVKCSQGS